jgi:threo-3-hydroxy-L-aspartate ammonia-lyase
MSAAALSPVPAAPTPSFADVASAAERIRGVAHRTPVLTSRIANERTGAELFFKAENLQRGGSFKFRGAYNAIAQLTPEARRRGVVAFSSGNHAQGIALASRLLEAPAVILMPADAPAAKLEATRAYGAEVILFERTSADRDALARTVAAERGLTLIPPFDHPDIVAGQGTAALELIEEVGPLDLLLVCLGGGGLLSGSALAAAERSPGCRVIGVEPEAGDDGQRSFREGRIVRIPIPASIADGALTAALGEIPFGIIRDKVADIVTVSDEALIEAQRFFALRMKIVVEPTGCLAAAAAFIGAVETRGLKVGVILSGGNVDPARFAASLAS